MAPTSPQEQQRQAAWDKDTNRQLRDKQRLAATAAVVGADQLDNIQNNEAWRQNYQQQQTQSLLAGQQPDDQYKNTGGWRNSLKAFNQERKAKSKDQRKQDHQTAKERNEQRKKGGKTVTNALSSSLRGVQLSTGRILQIAWLSVFETLGLTLIYVAFHIGMYKIGGIFRAFFMRPGQEWFMGINEFVDQAAKDSDGEGAGAFEASADLLEKGETCFCCLGCGLLITIILLLIMIMYITLSCEGAKLGVESLVGGTLGQSLGSAIANIRSLLPVFAGGCI